MSSKLRTIQYFLVANALVWIYLGVGWLNKVDQYPDEKYIPYLTAEIILGNAIFMLLLAYFLKYRYIWIYWIGVLYIFSNLFLTLTDQFGTWDFIILILEIPALFLLVINKKELT